MIPAPNPASQDASAKSRYMTLTTDRNPYLDRARQCASLTIPSLMPPDGHSSATLLPQPWQSIGAAGVKNLSNKLLLALFPPELPFFKTAPTEEVVDQAQGQDAALGEIQLALSKAERIILDDVETSGDRTALFEILKQLVNSGNVLLHEPAEGILRVFRLDSYVCKRDRSGNVLEIVIEEKVAYAALSPEHQQLVAGDQNMDDYTAGRKDVEVYTRVWRDGKHMRVQQEIGGLPVPKSEGHWPVDLCPWRPLRLTAIAGEDYGRSYVEEYLGDLQALDNLSQAIVEGSLLAAMHFKFVNPNGLTRKRDVEQAKNGDVLTGRADDVTVVQANKYGDMTVAATTAERIANRLEFAFLMHTAIQRQAERVTAEEIRYMAEELDATLGGVYTLLSLELQLPYVNLKIARLQRSKRLPRWNNKDVRIKVSTGLDAIGRGRDAARINQLVADARATFGEEAIRKHVNAGEWFRRRAAQLLVDPTNLIKTDDEVAQEAQAEMQNATMRDVAPEMMRQGGALVQQAMQPQPTQ